MMIRFKLLFFFFILVTPFSLLSQERSDIPISQPGKMDLSGWNFQEHAVLALQATWKQEKEGKITHRLSLTLPKDSPVLVLSLPFPARNYQVFLNEKKLKFNENLGIVPFVPQHENHFVIQIEDISLLPPKSEQKILLGEIGSVFQQQLRNSAFQLILFGLFLGLATYFLLQFVIRRRRKHLLYLGFLCFIFASTTILREQGFFYSILLGNLPWFFQLRMGIFIAAAMNFCCLFFFRKIYPEYSHHTWVFRLTIGNLGIVVLSMLHTQFFILMILFSLGNLGYIFAIVLKAFWRGDKTVLTHLAGLFVWIFFLIITPIFDPGILPYPLPAPLALVVFILSHALYLTIRSGESWRVRKAQSKRLRMLNRVNNQFLANTSYELKTPLYGIIGVGELLLEKRGEVSAKHFKQELTTIVNSAKRLAILVGDILDYSKLKNSGLQVAPKTLDLHQVAQVVVELTQPLLRGKPVTIKNIIDKNHFALADENRTFQVFHNLVSNAVKFTDSGSILLFSTENKDTIEVCVNDTGIGISEKKQNRIFEEFEQLNEATGAGLGLTITKQLIEKQGGKLWVESEVEEGSSFFFTLPKALEKPLPQAAVQEETILLEEPSQEGGEEKKTTKKIKSKQPKKHHLMIVDDDPMIRQILTLNLQAEYELSESFDGEHAWGMLQEGVFPDLILLDVMMPKMNGYELCKKIRASSKTQEIPIVFLSAKGQAEFATGINLGANDYITKPIYRNELLTRVKNVLERYGKISGSLDVQSLRFQLPKIIYIRALDGGSAIYLEDVKEPVKTSIPLKQIETDFNGLLLRVHKSFLVNPNKQWDMVKRKNSTRDWDLVYNDYEALGISRPHLPKVREALGKEKS